MKLSNVTMKLLDILGSHETVNVLLSISLIVALYTGKADISVVCTLIVLLGRTLPK